MVKGVNSWLPINYLCIRRLKLREYIYKQTTSQWNNFFYNWGTKLWVFWSSNTKFRISEIFFVRSCNKKWAVFFTGNNSFGGSSSLILKRNSSITSASYKFMTVFLGDFIGIGEKMFFFLNKNDQTEVTLYVIDFFKDINFSRHQV